MRFSRRAAISSAIALPVGLHASAQTPIPHAEFESKAYTFHRIDPDNMHHKVVVKSDLFAHSRVDEDGVWRYGTDGREHSHPVGKSQQAFRALINYQHFGDGEALEVAIANGQAILEHVVEFDGAYYFPYTESFKLHGFEDEVMEAPWYSGMGQGLALSAFLRLFEATGDQRWKDAADRTFLSFTYIDDFTRPWCTTTGQHSTLWFEEYPYQPPCVALNGHIYAAFGVYEYWHLTDEPTAVELLRGVFYTVEKLGQTFRNPGSVSVYCLQHRAVNLRYHNVHLGQLLSMYTMTHDPEFAQLHDDFYEDAPASQFITGTITLPAGPLETYEVWSTGSFKERRFVDIPEATEVPVNERFKVSGEGTFAYRVSGGEYEGLVVREQIDRIVVDGIVLGGQNENGPIWGTVRQYDPPRRAYFFSHPNYAYPNDNGQIGPRIPRAEFYMEGSVQVLAAGIENGRQLTLVSTEEFGEVWISGTPRYLDRDDVFDW